MSVSFSCVKSSNIIHKRLAHVYPILADDISEIQDALNVLTDYLETPTDVYMYGSLADMFERLLENVLEANEMIIEGIEICEEERDVNVKVHLENFLSTKFINHIKQAIILRDKAKLYGQNTLDFDRDIETFFILD
jgi:hypothetical protein